MGHANITTTIIYAHHVPKANAAAAGTAAVNAAMGLETATSVPA